MPATVPCQVGARIGKTGRQIFFSVADMTPVNGVCTPGVVVGVSGGPTVRRPDGTPVRVGRPRWCSQTRSIPHVSYGLLCGSVDRLLVVDGGEGYDPATVAADIDNTDTGGSGLSVSGVTVEQGVTSYSVATSGGPYPLPPTCTIVDLATTNPGSGALCYPIISAGQIRKVVIDPQHRGSGYQQPAFSVSSGVAAGVVVTDADGSVVEVLLTNFGGGYPNPPAAAVSPPPGSAGPKGNLAASAVASVYGADASAWGATPGSLRGVYPLAGGRIGCGQGYLATSPPRVTIAAPPAGGTLPVVTANVSGYVSAVKKGSGGTPYNSPPVVTLKGGTRPAVIRVVMTGAGPSDQFTYDAPPGWLTAAFAGGTGTTAGCTGVPVGNFSGQWEGPAGGLPGLFAKPTMLVGGNHGAQPAEIYSGQQTWANKLHTINTLTPRFGNGTVTRGPDNLPVSWTNPGGTVLGICFHDPHWPSGVDNMALPNWDGPWSIIYDDPDLNTPDAFCVALSSSQDWQNLVFTPRSLSGSSQPIVIPHDNITMAGTAISSISLQNLDLGGGWQGAGVFVMDPASPFGFCMANATVTDGVPTAINVVVPGSYGGKPTVYLYGTLVQGTQVSHVIDVEYIPTTTPGTGPSEWALLLYIQVAQAKGRWTWQNPWVTAPDPRTRQPSLSVDRSDPYLVDPWVLDQIRDREGTAVAAVRWMDAIANDGGTSTYTLAEDLMDGSVLPWCQANTRAVSGFQFIRPFNTDPKSTVYSWYSDRVYGQHELFAGGGSDGFGNYIMLPPSDMGSFLQRAPYFGVLELRSVQEHHLVTGQWVTFAGGVKLTFADGGANYLNSTLPVFVTSPTTVLFCLFCGGGANTKFSVQNLAGTAEIPVNVTASITNPLSLNTIPVEYAAAFSRQARTGLWLNTPGTATNDCLRAFTRKVIANIGPDVPVFVEHGNEDWQDNWPYIYWHVPLAGLFSYLPPDAEYLGTPMATFGGRSLIHNPWMGYALATANAHAVVLDEWTKAGLDPGRLRFVYGGQFGYDAVSITQIRTAFLGNFPIDYLCLAYYPTMPGDPSYVQAVSPPGSPVGSEESIPVDEIIELFRWYMMYNLYYWSYYAVVGSTCLNYGQPMVQLVGAGGVACTYNASGGVVTSVVVTSPGFGLMQSPVPRFATPPVAGGRAATGRSILRPSPIDRVVVVGGGKNYTNPQVTLTGGGGTYQSATAQVSGGVITGITVSGSADYVTTDDIVIQVSDPTGSGATFAVYLAPTSLASVQVIDGGAKYPDLVNAYILMAGGDSGMLQSGTYSGSYTFVDNDGVETTIGLSESGNFSNAYRNVSALSMPAWPAWAASLNFYLRPLGQQPARYKTFTRSQYQSTNPIGSPIIMDVPLVAGSPSPPTQASPMAAIARKPSIAHYEAAFQAPLPPNTPLQPFLLEDILMNPAAADMMDGLFQANQQGHPQHPGTGATLSLFFMIWGYYQFPNCWELAYGTQQLAGDGSGNLMCTPQGGEPADWHDHTRDNTSPTLNQLRWWASQTSPPGPYQAWITGPVS